MGYIPCPIISLKKYNSLFSRCFDEIFQKNIRRKPLEHFDINVKYRVQLNIYTLLSLSITEKMNTYFVYIKPQLNKELFDVWGMCKKILPWLKTKIDYCKIVLWLPSNIIYIEYMIIGHYMMYTWYLTILLNWHILQSSINKWMKKIES